MYTSLVTLVLRPLYPFQSFMMVLLSITIKIIINLDYNPVISSVRISGVVNIWHGMSLVWRASPFRVSPQPRA